ncbi:hypothetical protein Zmor_017023 [Zophobas morio]|uniref:TLC domain-containing protein n=1 Tax=Zophobas morio TaxID=2755281 RepID=A0AA38MC69_9CUCU|nr:hypothetical protein Zmor_017023 [Zophobas morio]
MDHFLLVVYPIIGCSGLLLLRFVLERFLFAPLGLWFGLRNLTTKKPPDNPILEKEFSRSKKWDRRQISGLSKQLDISEESIKDWLRLKLAQTKPSVLGQCCNSSWEFFYNTFKMLCGFVVLWDKPWLWDMDECWRDLANQTVTNDVLFYFIVCASCAGSQLIGLTLDEKRKDFYVTLSHHLALILLLALSGYSNFFRCVTVAIFMSDSSDVIIEASRVAKYLGYEKTSMYLFLIFTVWWIVVRLALHPFRVMKSFIVDAPRMIPGFSTHFTYYAISCLIVVFFTVNLLWTYFVLKAARLLFVSGKIKDSRSNSD